MKPDFIGVLESRRRPEIPGKGDTSVSPFFCLLKLKRRRKGTVFEIAKRLFPPLKSRPVGVCRRDGRVAFLWLASALRSVAAEPSSDLL